MTDGQVDTATVSQLIRAVEESRNYAFLIGAGTSRPSPAEIPTAGELIEMWQKESYEYENPDEEFEDWIASEEKKIDEENHQYGFWFEKRHPTRGERRERIQELVEGGQPTFGHIILASLMNQGYIPHTLTPNFDDLLFDAFYLYLEDRPQLINHRAVAPEFRLTRDRPAVVKLHGDYLYDNLRNTAPETDEDALDKGMKDVLEQTITEYGLVVIGYGGTDESIMRPLIETDVSEYGIYWCVLDSDNLSPKVEDLLKKPNTYLVEIDGFVSLMTRFGQRIDDLELPSPDQLVERAEERADMLEGTLKDRQLTAGGEGEEYINEMEKIWKADRLIREGDYNRAIEVCNEVIEQNPNNSDAFLRRGEAKAEMDEYDDAKSDYKNAIKIESGDKKAYHKLADLHTSNDRYEKAIETYSLALNTFPEEPSFYNNRGHIRALLGNHESAIVDFTKAIEVDPDNATAYSNRANIKIVQNDHSGSIKDATEAIQIDPTITTGYYNLGSVRLKNGNKKGALRDYTRAIEVGPENASAYATRAEVHLLMENYAEAQKDAVRGEEVSDDDSDLATCKLLYLISSIALGAEVENEEENYQQICDNDFVTTWRFEYLDEWVENAEISDEQKERVMSLIDLLREHRADH